MKQFALSARHYFTKWPLVIGTLACLCLLLSVSLLSTIPVRAEREEAGSPSIRSLRATPQARALMTQKGAQTKSYAQRQSRLKRPLTRIIASPGNLNALAHSLLRCYSLDGNAPPFDVSLFFSWRQGRAPPRII